MLLHFSTCLHLKWTEQQQKWKSAACKFNHSIMLANIQVFTRIVLHECVYLIFFFTIQLKFTCKSCQYRHCTILIPILDWVNAACALHLWVHFLWDFMRVSLWFVWLTVDLIVVSLLVGHRLTGCTDIGDFRLGWY